MVVLNGTQNLPQESEVPALDTEADDVTPRNAPPLYSLDDALSKIASNIENRIVETHSDIIASSKMSTKSVQESITAASSSLTEVIREQIRSEVAAAMNSILPQLVTTIANRMQEPLSKLRGAVDGITAEDRKNQAQTMSRLSNMTSSSDQHHADLVLQQKQIGMNLDRIIHNNMNHYFDAYNRNLETLSQGVARLSDTVRTLESKLDRIAPPTVPSTSQYDPLLLHHIARDFENKRYLSCFENALSSPNLPLLMSLCKRLSADEVVPFLKANQAVLLSLIQQLSFNWDTDQVLKLEWIRECLFCVELNDPVVLESGRVIFTFVQTQVGQLVEDTARENLDMVRQIISLTRRFMKVLA